MTDPILCGTRCPRIRILTCILPAGHDGDHESREYLGRNEGRGYAIGPGTVGVQRWTNYQHRKR